MLRWIVQKAEYLIKLKLFGQFFEFGELSIAGQFFDQEGLNV
jgi:hypothetical protein